MQKKSVRVVLSMVIALLPLLLILNGCRQSPTDSLNKTSMEEEKTGASDSYSIQVPDPEPLDLSSLAQIKPEEAQDAVLAAYPGAMIQEIELDNENGCLVYSVELNDGREVKVDAGNGEILYVDSSDENEEEDEDEEEDDDDNDEDDDDD